MDIKTDVTQLIVGMGKDEWFVYSVLCSLASGDVIRIKQKDLAKLLGNSERTVSRHIQALSTTAFGGRPLLTIQRTETGNVYTLVRLDT